MPRPCTLSSRRTEAPTKKTAHPGQEGEASGEDRGSTPPTRCRGEEAERARLKQESEDPRSEDVETVRSSCCGHFGRDPAKGQGASAGERPRSTTSLSRDRGGYIARERHHGATRVNTKHVDDGDAVDSRRDITDLELNNCSSGRDARPGQRSRGLSSIGMAKPQMERGIKSRAAEGSRSYILGEAAELSPERGCRATAANHVTDDGHAGKSCEEIGSNSD
eukprot:jgi/Undpi1/10937/HiC_scaffold_3.g01463.m1